MSEFLDKYKKDLFFKVFNQEVKLTWDEYEKLSKEEKKYCTLAGGNYFRRIPIDIPEDKQNEAINLKIFESIVKIDKNIKTIKNIMVFWLILTIIASFFLIIQIATLLTNK